MDDTIPMLNTKGAPKGSIVMRLFSTAKIFQLVFVVVAFFLSQLASAEIYQWRDEKGKLHFSDSPPPEVKAEKKEFPPINESKRVDIDYDAKRREALQKQDKRKLQQERVENRKKALAKCKEWEKEYVDLKWGRSQWADHTVLERDGKTISRREQNELAEKFRENANSKGCKIAFKKW